jgi:CBS domain-containing protein
MPIASIARLLAERGLSTVTVTSASGTLLAVVTELDLIRRLGEEGRAGSTTSSAAGTAMPSTTQGYMARWPTM